MKAKTVVSLLALLAIAVSLFFAALYTPRMVDAQTQRMANVFYASQFPGVNRGAKVAAAQAECSTDTSFPCIIILDPILTVYSVGTMPAKCASCFWMHYEDFVFGIEAAPLVLTMDNAADIVLNSFLTGDAVSRFAIQANGTVNWGGGAGALDTCLNRSAANTLAVCAGDTLTSDIATFGTIVNTGSIVASEFRDSFGRATTRFGDDFTTRGSLTGTTTETLIRSVQVVGNQLSANSCVEVSISGKIANGGTPNTKTIRMEYGTAADTAQTTLTSVVRTGANALDWKITELLCNRSSVSSQIHDLTATTQDAGTQSIGNTTTAVNTASNSFINITGQLVNAGDTIHVENMVVTWKQRGTNNP